MKLKVFSLLILLNMASNYESDLYRNDSDCSETDTDSLFGTDSDSGTQQKQVCRFYNKGNCRNGTACPDLHVCKYYLKGNCRYGSGCRLYHGSVSNSASNNQERKSRSRRTQDYRDRSRSSSSGSDSDTDSRPYRWQLNLGSGWQDVEHDYILEAHFSQPHTKGITIYNTPCGALSIDFTRMRILKKTNLRVRRRGSRNSDWLWYYRGTHGWYQFGKKDAKGNTSPVNSSMLESEFKKNPRGTLQVTIDSINYEIRFQDMCQKNLSTGRKRKIRRRPKFDSAQAGGVNTVANKFKSMLSSSQKAHLWQFSGRGGNWHNFSPKASCSVSSEDIEQEFHCNPRGSMNFTANGDQFTLDFSRMIQTNLKTRTIRNIRRVKQ